MNWKLVIKMLEDRVACRRNILCEDIVAQVLDILVSALKAGLFFRFAEEKTNDQ